jgi:nitroreductase
LKQLSTCGEWAGHLAGAALGVAILTPEPTEKFQTMFDAGQAAAFMQLAAWELGAGSVPASLYEHEKAREILGFPAEWHARIALSFGYPLEETKLSAPPKKGGRAAFEDVVHWEKW